jgi:hypothetical protein
MSYTTLITDGVTSLMPWAPSSWLAAKGPSASLDYTENVSYPLTDPDTGIVDPLQSLTLSVAPSGSGEMVASLLSIDSTGFLVTWWLSGGVPGRSYLIDLVGVTIAGRVFEWDWGILCRPILARYPLPLPLVPGFGPPLIYLPPVDGGLLGADGAQLLGADGAPLIGAASSTYFLLGADGYQLLGADGAQLTSASSTPTYTQLLGADGAQLIGADGAFLTSGSAG